MCSVHCLSEPKEVLRFPLFGSREHTISNLYLLCIMFHVRFSFLRCAQSRDGQFKIIYYLRIF